MMHFSYPNPLGSIAAWFQSSSKVAEHNGNDANPLIGLHDDIFLLIAQRLPVTDLSTFTQLCHRSNRYVNESNLLPSIPLIKKIAAKIQAIPTQCINGIQDINVFSLYSVKILPQEILISNDNPLSENQHLPIDSDFKIHRKVSSDHNTTCNAWHKTFYGIINANFDVESIETTYVNEKATERMKSSFSEAISLVNRGL
jgi:hypothetical protein